MVITFYVRSEGAVSWLKIDFKIKGSDGRWLRIHRAVNVNPKKLKKFKNFLRRYFQSLEGKLTRERFKEEFRKAYQNFTGEPLPEKSKGKKDFPPLLKDTVSSPKSFEHFARLYLDYVKAVKAPKTYKTRLEEIVKLLEVFKGKELEEITQEDLLKYQMLRKSQGVSNRTVNKEIACLRAMLNWAIDMGYIKGHRIKKFPMLPETKRLHAFLTEEELQKLLKALEHNRLLKLRVLFNVLTGLRPKEIACLEWQDVDFENKVLYVRSKPENPIKDYQERIIPLCEEALKVLKEAKKLSKGRYVFSRNDKPVFSIRKQLERACEKAGLRKVFPYMLRHSFAVLCLKSGVNIYDLKNLMGHSEIETTERYLHTTGLYLKQSVEKLGQFVNGSLRLA
ncbi:tyrosine-type recombinase/integrase [Thermodesulfobacterium hydrogeniphilum]|uniref:tyrosine-type recombinase/integrase n=1 Tax=Thermodesulfobacterium hydrogeniphilum TaxID=161156 RepID=UPI00056E325E|nr:site-specific integrase [Thermodesulfobacterium hydrogeniphilum]